MKLNSCPYCGGQVLIKKYRNTPIPVPKGLKKKSTIYICENFPRCSSFVGCTPNSSKPKGMLADKELRDLRKKAHALFDSLWKSTRMGRNAAYDLMSKLMGLSKNNSHIGKFNKEQCIQLIEKLNEFFLTPISSDEQFNILLTTGLWYVPPEFEPVPVPVIKRAAITENVELLIPTTECEEEEIKEIPKAIRYAGKYMSFDRQENDFLIYKYSVTKKIHGVVYSEYKSHIKTFSSLVKRNLIKPVKNLEFDAI